MVMPPGESGTYLVHFTGSKEHNVRLRAIARDRGWSLSEKGFLRLADDGEPLTGPAAELRTFATEAEVYALPGPGLSTPSCARTAARSRRPSTGGCRALELARPARRLPRHSDWSDGIHTSSRWPKQPASGATATWCLRTTRKSLRSPAA